MVRRGNLEKRNGEAFGKARHEQERSAKVIDLATGTELPARVSLAEPTLAHGRKIVPRLILASVLILAAIGALLFWSLDTFGEPRSQAEQGLSQPPQGGSRLPMPTARAGAFDPASDVRGDVMESEPAAIAAPGLSPVLAFDPGAGVPPPPAEIESQLDPLPRRNRYAMPTVIFDSGGGPGASVMVDESTSPAGTVLDISKAETAAEPARHTTILRGTLIPAVLSTAIDTQQPGYVRAIVSTAVKSPDGKRTLVPRSSKLVGQYRAGRSAGDQRAYIIWTRIEPPSGEPILLGSPSDRQEFFRFFDEARLLSVVSGEKGAARVRVRPGEPIRVFAARKIELAAN